MPRPVPTSASRISLLSDPVVLVELFAVGNLGFLGVDIAVAHAVNAFAHRAEWVPLAFSGAATVLLLIALALGGLRPSPSGKGLSARGAAARRVGLAVGWGAVVVGVVGLVLHLESQFFGRQTLKDLVYTAPFAAPLAYAGVGLLLILDRMIDARSVEWARWVVLLALGGFVGNFVLTLADHAQNGFFHPAEWVGVIASALAVGVLTAVVALPDDGPARRLGYGVMAAQVVVGGLGEVYHVAANLAATSGTLWEKFLYGAPAFAPLLFANLAVLGVIGLMALSAAVPE